MTDQDTKRSVVVATDGSSAGLRGVSYAALEARRLGVGLEIVHVVPRYLPTGPLPMIPDGALQQFGQQALEHGAEAAHNAAPDVQVASRLVSGSRVRSIIEAAANAPLLVLASRGLSLGERVWTGATVAGVCSRARCPVVVIPEDWPVRDPGAMSRVVVGFKSPEHAAELLTSALALAGSRGAELVVLHAWKLPGVYDDVVTGRVDEEQWRDEQRAMIEAVLSQVRAPYADVEVSIQVMHDRPAHALTEASRDCERLVISRPVHGGHFHHLGAVARAVLREAHCPVEVLPPPARTGESPAPTSEDGSLRTERQMTSAEQP